MLNVIEHKTVEVLGVELKILFDSPGDYVVNTLVPAKSHKYVCVSNVHQLTLAAQDENFKKVLDGGVCIPDSMVLYNAARFLVSGLGGAKVFRGAELVKDICRSAQEQGLSVGCFGGDDTTNRLMVAELQSLFPRLKVAYSHSPAFSENGDGFDAELPAIQEAKVDILLVGLGCPKQERWMYSYAPSLPGIAVGVGAAFDFIAGTKRPSPEWVHRFSLDWLYRLAIEPRRLWWRYLYFNSLFCILLAKQKCFK